jgi:mannose-6-phosphate isomerase-like protein (cupin superfamily)
MRLRFVLAVIGLAAFTVGPAGAQDTPRADRPIRLVLASGKLRLDENPLHFRLVRVTIPAGQSIVYTGPQGMIYPTSGALSITIDGDRRVLQDGEGAFLAGGRRATLGAGTAAATFLHYLLVGRPEIETVFHGRPATASDLQRTEPIPALKAGPHEFTLTRVTVNPKIPAPPMHHRSGAAIYFVVSGNWIMHTEDKHQPRTRGHVQFEPNTFIHTWENVGETPGALLQANVSPENVPEIIFIKRP